MELLWATLYKSNSFDDHLVVTLQILLVDKSHVMNIYKAYTLPLLHLIFPKTFQYSIEEEYPALSSDSD